MTRQIEPVASASDYLDNEVITMLVAQYVHVCGRVPHEQPPRAPYVESPVVHASNDGVCVCGRAYSSLNENADPSRTRRRDATAVRTHARTHARGDVEGFDALRGCTTAALRRRPHRDACEPAGACPRLHTKLLSPSSSSSSQPARARLVRRGQLKTAARGRSAFCGPGQCPADSKPGTGQTCTGGSTAANRTIVGTAATARCPA
jgi:hypothetical protein